MQKPIEKIWGYQAVHESFELDEYRRATGWVKNTVPKATEFNQWQKEVDKDRKDTKEELEALLGYVGAQADEESGSGQLLVSLKKLVLKSLKEDPKSFYHLAPVGKICVYNQEYGSWQDNITLPGWLACVKRNSRTSYEAAGKTLFVPDLGERFLSGAQTEEFQNKRGGQNHLKLSTEQMPMHGHTTFLWEHTSKHSSSGNTFFPLSFSSFGLPPEGVALETLTSFEGQSQAFDNRPAYYKVLYIIKVHETVG